ncbi:MAG: Gfo/Idh/MocA family protein [Spirochaetia bacterium]
MQRFRWGIIATGNIANRFAEQAGDSSYGTIHAVGSRSTERAEAFAAKYGIPNYYGSYKKLAEDPDVDGVYIATPHHRHKDDTILALNAGKHVLCEKPIALNAKEAEEMRKTAKEKDRFLMEAMWMRFNPAIVKVRQLLSENLLGELTGLRCDFSFYAPFDREHRLFNLNLAGGALLDIGVYPISFAFMVLGKPSSILSSAVFSPTGSDSQNSITFEYSGNKIATLTSGFTHNGERNAAVFGNKGRLEIAEAWHRSRKVRLVPNTGAIQEWNFTERNYSLHHQGDHMISRLRDGFFESDVIPLHESIEVMRAMDTIRSQWGLVYPAETI